MVEGTIDAEKKDGNDLPRLRTYSDDVAHVLRQEDVSVTTMVLKEHKRKEEEQSEVKHELKVSKILVALISFFILAGVLSILWVFFLRNNAALSIPRLTERLPESLVRADSRILFDLSGRSTVGSYRELAHLSAGGTERPGLMEEIVPVLSQKVAGETQTKTLSAAEFLAALDIKPPDRFVRFLDKRFEFGIYSYRANSGFFIWQPTSYGPVYAELLAWEKDLPSIFYPLLSGKDLKSAGKWQDAIIKNIDVRILKDSGGKILLLYAFLPNRTMLVMTSDPDTFGEIVIRVQTPPPVSQ